MERKDVRGFALGQARKEINAKLTSNYTVINVEEREGDNKHIIAVNCPYNYSLIVSDRGLGK